MDAIDDIDAIDDFDENGNFYMHYVLAPMTPEQEAAASRVRETARIYPISRSYLNPTTFSDKYARDATKIIKTLLYRRKTGLNDGDHKMVLVWDIGEITTLTITHLAHIISFHRDTNAQSLSDITQRILDKANICCNYDEDHVTNIEDVEDMRERAPMYDALEEFYNEISDGMRDDDDGRIINYELIEKCGLVGRAHILYLAASHLQRIFHQRWKTARKCLEIVNKQSDESYRQYENVVLCENGIGDGLAQLLVAGCSKYIPVENVFSLYKRTEESVFERIQKRFGKKCLLVYITSRPDKARIPKNLQVPIWKMRANDSIEDLCDSLQKRFFHE